jgi:hypothetical protein
MTEETRVLYNDTCPVCSFEVAHYRRLAEGHALPVAFDPLARTADWGMTKDQAARSLHVRAGGGTPAGLAAFRALSGRGCRGRGGARGSLGLPVVRPLPGLLHDRPAAPLRRAAHRRRQTRLTPPAAPADCAPASDRSAP